MDTESESDIWAIVETASRTFIGQIRGTYDPDFVGGIEHRVRRLDTLLMKPVYELTAMNIPMRGPQGQMIFNREISAQPYYLSFEECALRVQPVSVMLFSDMSENDRARYKGAVKEAEALATAARAKAAGIVPPKG